jgi:hypothetical protein
MASPDGAVARITGRHGIIPARLEARGDPVHRRRGSTMRIVHVAGLALALALSAAPALGGHDHDLEQSMIESASTPAQHEALAKHFRARAEAARNEAARHRAMGKSYAGGRMARSPQPPSTHCTKLADSFDAQAAEYDALAAAHEAEAKQ